MKSHIFALVLSCTLALAACSEGPSALANSAGGSIAITRDDALLYAADADRDSVFIIDAITDDVLAEVKVGRQPEKVLVARDGTVYVTNRMGRSVSVLRRGETTESARIEVAVEPVGLALSADEKTLYVINAASLDEPEFGTLMAVATATLQVRWELPVGHEPRGIALLDDTHAVVTQYKDGDVVHVDLARQQVLSTSSGLFTSLNASFLGLTNTDVGDFGDRPVPQPAPAEPFPGNGTDTNFSTAFVRPRGMEAVVVNPHDKQVYVASLLSSEQTLPTKTDVSAEDAPFNPGGRGGSSGGYSGGNCGAAAVASPTLITLSTQLAPSVDDVGACSGNDALGRPTMTLSSNDFEQPIQGPAALAVDPSGSFVFIANRESNNLAIVPTANRGDFNGSGGGFGAKPSFERSRGGTVQNVIPVGDGPTGVAVSHDGTRAWVLNAFSHSVSKITSRDARTERRDIALGADVLPADVVAGRKLFFSATDARMNNPATGISCATCHLEGREDGHVWNTMEGPRQTPSLAGRMTAQTAPFHWNGEFENLLAFMSHTVTRRMGGSGVSNDMERQVAAFIASIPRPDTAVGERTPGEVLARGRAAFEKAECNTCHAGETLTDNSFANVGTMVREGTVVDRAEFNPKGLNTPSLLGAARSGPYLHDGSAVTLRARIEQGKLGDLHGKTSTLSGDEVSDLVTYLKTL
ncbi:MAG: c-type cytochrome [Archangium sp.]|nr:c-type cytochrome [Archangium sp.]